MYLDRSGSNGLVSKHKSQVGAYAATIIVSILLTAVVMAGVEGPAAIPAEPSLYTGWTMIAGAVGGGLAFFASKGWFGQSGKMGVARAIVGSAVVVLLGAAFSGLMILPALGAFYAPVMVVTEFVARPIIAAVWFAVMFGAHLLMKPEKATSNVEYEAAAHRPASATLSNLTRANLYRD